MELNCNEVDGVLDVVTLGETMVRLTPPGYHRLEEAARLDVEIGGSESNVAVALCRLGLRAAWAGRLPRNALGRLVFRRLQSFGVDLGGVCWADGERMGLYFIEAGAPPRSSTVLYDRAGSAAAAMRPEDFDWELLARCRHVHLGGITPALGPGPRDVVRRALAEARRAGATVSFDVNYRARLWDAGAARESLAPLIREVDLLISTASDARTVFALQGGEAELCAGLAGVSGAARVALTLPQGGAVLWTGGEVRTRTSPLPVQTVDRVGAGDAFAAGLVYGLLAGDDDLGLRLGSAMAALKHTMPGDLYTGTLEEALDVMERGHGDIRR